MLVQENEKMVSVSFNSILDLLEFDTKDHINKTLIEKYLKTDDYVDSSKYGSTNNSYKDVRNHALIGDKVLLTNLQEKLNILDKVTGKNTTAFVQKVQKSKRVRSFSDQGDELDIEKVYNGELDTCWSKTIRKEFDASHKFVTLFIENGGAWKTSVRDSFWRAAIAVYLTRELQAAGKSVRIVVGGTGVGCFKRNSKILSTSMTVKEYNQQINLERVAAMTHLGFFRCMTFATMNVAPYRLSSGYGSFTEINAETYPIQLQEQVSKGHTKLIHIKPVLNQYSALDALKYAYEQLGVK